MPRFKRLLLVGIVVVGTMLCMRGSLSGAPEGTPAPKAKNWEHVQVVAYASGLTGFFHKSTGRLYLYGSDLKTPFMVSEIQMLGEPLKIVKAPPGQ